MPSIFVRSSDFLEEDLALAGCSATSATGSFSCFLYSAFIRSLFTSTGSAGSFSSSSCFAFSFTINFVVINQFNHGQFCIVTYSLSQFNNTCITTRPDAILALITANNSFTASLSFKWLNTILR